MPNSSQNIDEIKLEKEFSLSGDFSPPTYEEWKIAAEQYLKGVPFEKALVTRTYEGIDLQPIYRREDIENLPHLEKKPGFGNFARGTSAEGYLDRSWEICQTIPYSLPEEFNKALKHDLERGQTAVNLVLDKSARMGVDADTAEADDQGDVGGVGVDGVSISHLEDLSIALKDIDLGKFPIHIDAGLSGLEMVTALAALLKKEGKAIAKLKGSVCTDPVGFLALHGKLPFSMETAYNRPAQVVRWAVEHAPQIKTVGISGVPYHNAGASAVQELAYALATAVEYIDRLSEQNLSIDQIAGSMRFTFAVGPFYFMEVAKLRAARILWAKIVEAYGGNKESQKMTIHGVTSFHNQTMYDPYVNMLRTTTEAFSAVVGGVDSLQTNPFDETFGPPDEFSRRIARNTQIILDEETQLDQLIDPAGGSYYVEKLTHEVAEKAWALFREIEKRGGMLKALTEGYPQEEIEAVTAKRNKDLAKRKSVLVGTNTFADVKEEKLESKAPDYDAVRKTRTRQLKTYRDAAAKDTVSDALSRLTASPVEASIEALTAGATIGEVFAALGAGESPQIKPLNVYRAAEMFEELRDAVAAYEAKTGAKPKLFLANMGPLRQYKARADFTRGFFETGGFDIVYPKGFETPEAAVDAAIQSRAPVVVICSTDPTYPELVPPVTKGLKEINPDIIVVLAGYPKDQVEAHKQSGVDEFIYLGADARQILSNVLTRIGVLS
jgi:methylmalonyl-CoA mutase